MKAHTILLPISRVKNVKTESKITLTRNFWGLFPIWAKKKSMRINMPTYEAKRSKFLYFPNCLATDCEKKILGINAKKMRSP